MAVKKLVKLVKVGVQLLGLVLYKYWLTTRFFFGRRPSLIKVLIIATILLGFSLAIQFLKEPPCPEYMSWSQCISEQVFKYLYDWAIILSASLLFVVIVITWLTMIENKRRRDKIVITDWCNFILNIIGDILSVDTTRKGIQIWEKNRIKLAEGHIIAGVNASNLNVETRLKMDKVLRNLENVRKNLLKNKLKTTKKWCGQTALELMRLLRLVS